MKNQLTQEKYLSQNPFVKAANKRFFETVDILLKKSKASNVIEAGCGEGMVIQFLKKKNQKVKFTGFDVNRKLVKIAQQINPDSRIQTASIYQIPYPDNFFDLTLCLEVLEHLDRPGQALAELWRVTSKYAIVSVPCEPFFRLANMARLKYLARFGNTPGHINHWSKAGFQKFILEKFQIKKELYPFSWMIFLLEK